MNLDEAADRREISDLIENHLSVEFRKSAGLAALATGVSQIGAVFEAAQANDVDLRRLLGRMRQAIRELRAAIQFSETAAGADPLREFARRQLVFAELLERRLAPYAAREMIGFFVREPREAAALRGAIAGAFGVPEEEVRGLMEDAVPVVRIETFSYAEGFAWRVELYVDTAGASLPDPKAIAAALARRLACEVAHHESQVNPYEWVVTQPDGGRRIAFEKDADAEGLILL